MPPQMASIQSFIVNTPQKHNKSSTDCVPGRSFADGDGFTQAEIDTVMNPRIDDSWVPDRDYDELDIISLEPGPKCVTFVGRIVNFLDQMNWTATRKPQAAKGCLRIIVKDETAAVTVRLWYARISYPVKLGQLVTVWTPHISSADKSTLSPPSVPLFTSIFPERDRCCHFMIHTNSDTGSQCRTPLGFRPSQPIPGLMTLQAFLDGGHEIVDGRVMAFVRSIGPRRTYTNKQGVASVCTHIGLSDDTAEATLSLWGALAQSVAIWEVSKTVLLLTNPSCRADKRSWISVNRNTMVDVDPEVPDAFRLKTFAQRLLKRECVNLPYPESVFDTEAAEDSAVRILFSLADIDSFVRAAPGEQFVGYLNLVIMELHLVALQRRRRLMCAECCGIPIYSNFTRATCKQCEKEVVLRINPRVVGMLIDETGSIAAGKLIFSDCAWNEVFGCTADDLARASTDDLSALEHQLLFLRISLGFGWAAEQSCGAEHAVGRLCIWGVRM